jgi:hypothetical protein
MKPKNKTTSLLQQSQGKANSLDIGRAKAWRRILPRLLAVFLIIVFLASECAALLPGG